jgi:DNA polymerase III subunit epsilon
VSTRLKFVAAVAALFLYMLAALVLLWVAVRSDASSGERSVLDRVLSREASLAAFCAVLFLLGLAFLVSVFFKHYVHAPRRLAREAELIATANPAHRVEPSGASETRELAAAINKLAATLHSAREQVGTQIAVARADVEDERNRLAALMSELTLAVLVCNAEGRILLYNAAAKELLAHDGGGSGLVGLGRSIFGILDRSLVGHALERMGEAADDGRAVHLTATTGGGRLLRCGMAPVRDREGELSGFVLTLEDVTRAAEESARREALLRSLTEGTRAAVGSIRAAGESLLEYPEMDPSERARFIEIVRDEALALSDQVSRAMREAGAQLGDRSTLADVLGRDLLSAARRRLERDTGVPADIADGDGDLWLRVDSYAVVLALAHLARRLRAELGPERFSVELRRAGRHAALELHWRGAPVPEETLHAWAAQPLAEQGPGAASTLADVVAQHGGEVWGEADDDGRSAMLRLLLPLAETTAAPPEHAQPAAAPAERQEFYDFDLLREGELGPEWEGAELRKLPCTVFDTETTGLNPTEDELISIGAVRIVNGRLLRSETFDQLIEPGRPVRRESVAVHGISAELLEGQPPVEEVLPQFARFAEDTVLVGHNVSFDLRFFELDEHRTGVNFTQPALDTLLLSAVVHPDQRDHSLEAMAERLGVSVVGRHTALGDAILTGEIFLKQTRLLAEQGLVTLGEVREAARHTYLARVSDSLYTRG